MAEKIRIIIVGSLRSVAYQKAKLYAKKLYTYHPKSFEKPKVREMLEFEWYEYITEQRRIHGNRFWALRRPVAVYYNDEFIGSDEELFDIIQRQFTLSVQQADCSFSSLALRNYEKHLIKSSRLFAFLCIEIEDGLKGVMLFELYCDLLPKTCRRFAELCNGTRREDLKVERCYKFSQIHRICKSGWIQGGDTESICKSSEQKGSPRQEFLSDEGFCVSHNRRGVLSFANKGKNTNNSQFFITLQPSTWMDSRYVAFGQLVEGSEILSAIENVPTYYESPLKSVTITKCGSFNPITVKRERKRKEINQLVANIVKNIMGIVEQNISTTVTPYQLEGEEINDKYKRHFICNIVDKIFANAKEKTYALDIARSVIDTAEQNVNDIMMEQLENLRNMLSSHGVIDNIITKVLSAMNTLATDEEIVETTTQVVEETILNIITAGKQLTEILQPDTDFINKFTDRVIKGVEAKVVSKSIIQSIFTENWDKSITVQTSTSIQQQDSLLNTITPIINKIILEATTETYVRNIIERIIPPLELALNEILDPRDKSSKLGIQRSDQSLYRLEC